jgi:hypothetical protein
LPAAPPAPPRPADPVAPPPPVPNEPPSPPRPAPAAPPVLPPVPALLPPLAVVPAVPDTAAPVEPADPVEPPAPSPACPPWPGLPAAASPPALFTLPQPPAIAIISVTVTASWPARAGEEDRLELTRSCMVVCSGRSGGLLLRKLAEPALPRLVAAAAVRALARAGRGARKRQARTTGGRGLPAIRRFTCHTGARKRSGAAGRKAPVADLPRRAARVRLAADALSPRTAGAGRAPLASLARAGAARLPTARASAAGRAARSGRAGSAIWRRTRDARAAAGVTSAGAGLATGTPDLIRRAPSRAAAALSAHRSSATAAPAAAGCSADAARARSTAAVGSRFGRRSTRSNRQQQQKSAPPNHRAHRGSIMHAMSALVQAFPGLVRSPRRIRAVLSRGLKKLMSSWRWPRISAPHETSRRAARERVAGPGVACELRQ